MKIAFILPSLSNHGPNVFTLNLVNGLMKIGVRPVVFFFSYSEDLKFPVECIQVKFSDFSLLNDFDVIHSTMLRADLFLAFHKRNNGPKLVSGIHNFFDEDLHFLYSLPKAIVASFVWRWSFSRISNGIVSSGEMRDYYLSKVNAEMNLKEIPYGINIPCSSLPVPSEFVEKISFLRSKNFKIVGSCGLLIRRKGYDTLLHAAALSNDIAVVLVGGGPERLALESLAEELKIADRVIFVGQQPDSFRFYDFFDIFAMTSLSEGFGIAMLEALSLGLPLVCSNLGIYKGYFSEDNVSLFSPGNVCQLNAAIIKALTEREVFGRHSFDLYIDNFTLDIMAKRHVDFYRELID